MSKIFSVVNKKGGVGKTTTVSALSSICALEGKKVLVVDLDPQINSTSLFVKEIPRITVADVLRSEKNSLTREFMEQAILKTKYENIDILPGDVDLDEQGDIILLQNATTDGNNIILPVKAQTLLLDALNLIKNQYDVIFIDNTPYFNLISKNALAASDGVLIPVEADGYSYDGLSILLNRIYTIKGDVNNNLKIIGAFFTDVYRNTNLFTELEALFRSDLGATLMNTHIRHDNKVKESGSFRVPLAYFNYKCKATEDYYNLAREINLI